ncbi:Uncharacterized protein Fot_34610 [Forsythia ovata]|uniref:Uncharacterized protein n=1 Tax=Forsythia ovata TaxID=205694 RepID=A0ABD1SJ59_9LAMI
MSSSSERHKSSSSVKLAEILELLSSESDVPDDKVVDGKLENDGNATGVPEGAYVPEFSENVDCNIEVDWEAFLDRYQEDISNSWEDGLWMNNEEETQLANESEEHEVQIERF